MPRWLVRRLPPGRASAVAAWLTILACAAVVVGVVGPTVLTCSRVGGRLACEWSLNHVGSSGDWRYFAESWEAARVTLGTFHQFPSWMPWQCGGVVFYQDPQAPFPGPIFLLTFWWLPTGVGIKVWIWAHFLAGVLGARVLVRDAGGNGAEQVLGAVLTSACGFFAWHTGGGHLSFTPFLFLPLILWAWRRSLADARWAVLVAALFALSFYEGGTYPVPLMLLVLGVDALARVGSAQGRRAVLVSLPVVLVLFALLSGLRLVPVLRYLREHPRLVPLDDQMTLAEVFGTWLLRWHPRSYPGHIYVWDEYANYVGVIPVLLMLAGVVVALVRRDAETRQRRTDVAILAVLVWAALGNIPAVSLYGLLHELPIFASLRVPSRFLGASMVAFALVAVSALKTARQAAEDWRLRPRVMRALLAVELLVVVAIAVDVCATNQTQTQLGLDPALPRARASAAFHQDTGAAFDLFPTFPVRGIGTRVCYQPLQWKPAPGIVDGDVPQARVQPAAAGTVVQRRWTPNELALEATLRAPGIVVVNQNYESGWRADHGQIGAWVAPEARFWPRPAGKIEGTPQVGLLAVSLPAGTHALTLRHRPAGLGLGAVLVLMGLALAFAAMRMLAPARLDSLRARLARRLSSSP
jgi:hypothetical protein